MIANKPDFDFKDPAFIKQAAISFSISMALFGAIFMGWYWFDIDKKVKSGDWCTCELTFWHQDLRNKYAYDGYGQKQGLIMGFEINESENCRKLCELTDKEVLALINNVPKLR